MNPTSDDTLPFSLFSLNVDVLTTWYPNNGDPDVVVLNSGASCRAMGYTADGLKGSTRPVPISRATLREHGWKILSNSTMYGGNPLVIWCRQKGWKKGDEKTAPPKKD